MAGAVPPENTPHPGRAVGAGVLILRGAWDGQRALGGVPEWLKGADCKSAGERLRRFESYPHHDRVTVQVVGDYPRV